MSVPSGSVQKPLAAGVTKPSLPHGWSCHVSKSIPGKCYYFNRFTGEKTWELGELLPGHAATSTPVQVSSLGSANHTLNMNETQHQHHDVTNHHQSGVPGQSGHHHHGQLQAVGMQNHPHLALPDRRTSLPAIPPNQNKQPQSAGLAAQADSLSVSELEAMLAEQKRKLQEMTRKQLEVPVPRQSGSHSHSLTNSKGLNCSGESSSTESGFVSLTGGDEVGGLGLAPGIGNRVRRKVSVRQRELNERGGLYRDWGQGVEVGEAPNWGSKRGKIEVVVGKSDSVTSTCSEIMNRDDIDIDQKDDIDKTDKSVGHELPVLEIDNVRDYNADKNNPVDVNQNVIKGKNVTESDSNILSEEDVFDSEELAEKAKLDNKFPSKQALDDDGKKTRPSYSGGDVEAELSPHIASAHHDSPELLLWDNDCQFSPEPASEEEDEEDDS